MHFYWRKASKLISYIHIGKLFCLFNSLADNHVSHCRACRYSSDTTKSLDLTILDHWFAFFVLADLDMDLHQITTFRIADLADTIRVLNSRDEIRVDNTRDTVRARNVRDEIRVTVP